MKPESDNRWFKVPRLFTPVVIGLFILHQASWLNANAHLVAGLPAGLWYHLGYCVLVALVLSFFVYRRTS